MYKFAFAVISVLCVFKNDVSGFGNDGQSARILNGDDADIKDFPHYAGLLGCGAAILSDRWVLTAAHCVYHRHLKLPKFVWVGGDSFENSRMVAYDKIVYHPNMSLDQVLVPMNDLALLHLVKPLTFTEKIMAAELPTYQYLPSPYSKLVFAGRGRDETASVSKSLKKMDVHRLTSEECLDHMPDYVREAVRPYLSTLEKFIMCAKRAEGTPGLCNGDSGSPLTEGRTLVGIASFIGGSACEKLHLGFYVNVANYVPWIKSVTGLK